MKIVQPPIYASMKTALLQTASAQWWIHVEDETWMDREGGTCNRKWLTVEDEK